MLKISIYSGKGGTGKTTTAVHLASALATRGRRVLVIDADPQIHATRWLYDGRPECDLGDALGALDAVGKVIVPARWEGVCLLAGSPSLGVVADRLLSHSSAGTPRDPTAVMRRLLRGLDGYDVAILDCAPGVSALGANCLAAADLILAPTMLGSLPGEGLADLAGTLVDMQREGVVAAIPPLLVAAIGVRSPRSMTADERAMLAEIAQPGRGYRYLGEVPYRARVGGLYRRRTTADRVAAGLRDSSLAAVAAVYSMIAAAIGEEN